MAKKKNQSSKKTIVKKRKVSKPTSNISFFDRANNYISSKSTLFFILSFICCAIVSLLLFDMKVSIGGDDSSYISRAYNFIHKGIFPRAQGPLYPIVLSLPIAIFGINVPLLKLFSLVFILIHLYFFNRAIKGIVSPLVQFFTIFLVAINGYMAFFASSTYSEAFFLMLQGIFLFYFMDHFVKAKNHTEDTINVKHFLVLGLIIFLSFQTRFVSIAGLGAVIIFFLAYKQWKRAGAALGGFLAYFIPFTLLSKLFIEAKGMSKQLEVLMLKHPYKPQDGTEDVMGFLTRIVDNSNLYIGRTFLVESGLRPSTGATIDGSLTILVYIILVVGFIFAIRNKNKGVVFSYIYTGAVSILTFLVLQKFWDQSRMITIMYPFLWMLCLYLLYQLFSFKTLKSLQVGFVVIAVLFVLPQLNRSFTKISEHSTTLRKNISGDALYGLTEDWVNYISAVKWGKKNLPKDYVMVARKPQIAFIYSNGTKHVGGGLKEANPDIALANLKEKNATHIIRASLRLNPAKRTQRVINTVHIFMARIEQQYPGTFIPIHSEGTIESATIYKINYPSKFQ